MDDFTAGLPRAVELQGHRGARGLAPENTLAGFQRAVSLGVHSLELDVGLSADDRVVVHHDFGLNPETTRDESGRWIDAVTPIRALTIAELKRFDVGRIRPGSEYDERFPNQRPVDGARIPTLAEVFEWAQAGALQSLRFNIEVKCNPIRSDMPTPAEFVTALLEDIDDYQMQSRIWVESFDWRVQHELKRRRPQVPTAHLTAQQPFLDTLHTDQRTPSPWLAGFHIDAFGGSVAQMVAAAGACAWCPHHLDLTRASVAEAHTLGLTVFTWTVNDIEHIRRAIACGVDGIITDYPDRARRAFAQCGLALPAPR